MDLYTLYYSSPVGLLKLQGTGQSITSIHFMEDEPVEKNTSTAPASLQSCCLQLDEYFKGERKAFDLPLHQTGTTFQQNVWSHLQQIPYGKTISYLHLSKQIGDVKAIRAVASANGRNNLAIVVPCHRVIGSNAKLVGYAGGLWRKKWLLDHEAKHHSGVQAFDF